MIGFPDPAPPGELPPHMSYGVYNAASKLGDVRLNLLQVCNVDSGIENLFLPIDE